MSGQPRVLFLADSGPAVGGGHVMRSLTLAKALEAKGATCTFVGTPPVQHLLSAFGGPAGSFVRACEADDLSQLGEIAVRTAREQEAQVVVVDHYRLGADLETRLRPAKVVVFDDLADRPHACDLLVDPGVARTASDYDGLAPEGARRLIGPQYALLRPQFAALREETLARRRRGGPPERALIALGLTDVEGLTRKVVAGLLHDFGRMSIDVVVGRDAESLPFLQGLSVADQRLRVHVETPRMAELMAEADISIGAGGSSMWERACLGLPGITIVAAENQRAVAAELAARGATLVLHAHALAFEAMLSAEWYNLAANATARLAMAERSAALCDGLGAERVADAVMELVR